MISTRIPDVQTQTVSERDSLRADLEAARARFHELLNSILQDQWRRTSDTSKWTTAEIFVHLTWALEYLPKEVEKARKGKGMFNFPKWLADPFSYWYIRFTARNSTPAAIRSRYDAAMDAAIEALNTVPESDWGLGAEFYGEGFHSVADLFRAACQHLVEHTVGL